MSKSKSIDSFINQYITKREKSLLYNDLREHHTSLANELNGKNVLVIGGAGSIGSSYIKALIKFNVEKLVVVDINENGLTELVRDLRSSSNFHIPPCFITYPVNYADTVFERIYFEHGPFDVVANFAAHKHVRSEKDVFSIEAMLENNLFRAEKLLQLLTQQPPKHFFCVSTDKAANPVNIMGASKKLMEELILAYSDVLPVKTARFANVAFSNGSLPLGFLERLNKKQPWSCPLGIKRFFVSPQESGELCLIASILGQSGDIFFPQLDEHKDMISFDRIALDLMSYLGLKPYLCKTEDEAKSKVIELSNEGNYWPLYFFESDTSGEKPYEEFFTDEEIIDVKSFQQLGVIKNSGGRNKKEMSIITNNLRNLFQNGHPQKNEIVEVLNRYLPNFDHVEKGLGLDAKM